MTTEKLPPISPEERAERERVKGLEQFRERVMSSRLLSGGLQTGWNVSALTKLYNEQSDAAPSPIRQPKAQTTSAPQQSPSP